MPIHDCISEISEILFSPNNKMLAVASHDQVGAIDRVFTPAFTEGMRRDERGAALDAVFNSDTPPNPSTAAPPLRRRSVRPHSPRPLHTLPFPKATTASVPLLCHHAPQYVASCPPPLHHLHQPPKVRPVNTPSPRYITSTLFFPLPSPPLPADD
jgi:hypothetical protein